MIKQAYDYFYKSLLKEGKLPLKDTKIGFWAISSADEVFKLFQKIKLHKYKHFLDIGAGDGKVVMIASLFTKADGIEYDEWLVNQANVIKSQLMHIPNVNKSNIIRGDFMKHNLSDYDVIFWHPDKKIHELDNKLLNELKGDLIVHGPIYHPEQLIRKETHNIDGTYMTVYTNRVS